LKGGRPGKGSPRISIGDEVNGSVGGEGDLGNTEGREEIFNEAVEITAFGSGGET